MIRTQIESPKIIRIDTTRPRTAATVLKDVFKRLFDITMSLIGILILSPVLALISFLIKRDSPGPVFYWGPRAGKDGKPFKILKFRTMFERPESYAGPRVTAQGDNRITPLGAWLRYTKINELPQLWNVLVGEMSLVGPRPEDVEIAKNWPEDARHEILSVRPGITSPASILYHDEEKLLSKNNLMEDYFQSILPNKMRLDRLYVRYHSFFTDLDIIFWTIAVLIPRLANAKIPEGYLFAGPFSSFINRYLNWFLADFAVSILAVFVCSSLWLSQSLTGWNLEIMAVLALLQAFIFNGFNTFFGLNRILWTRSTSEDGVGLLFSGGLTLGVVVFLSNNFPAEWVGFSNFPTSLLTLMSMLSALGFILIRYRLRVVTIIANRWLNLRQNQMVIGERVLIVGAGEGSRIAAWLLKRRMFRSAFSIVGMVDDNDPTLHGLRVGGYWMLGGFTDLPSIVEKNDIGVILSTIPNTNPQIDEYIFSFCRANGIRLIFLDDLLHVVDKQVTQPLPDEDEEDYPLWRADNLEFKAIHDVTTRLPNRYLLQERLRHSLSYSRRYNTNISLMFIDLEGLASINDNLGRKYGDDVLVQAADRLMTCKRESDTLARSGDQQFALIFEHLSSEDEAEMIARRIYRSLVKPFFINGTRYSIEPHIGVCHGGEITDLEKLDITTCYQKRAFIEVKTQHEHAMA